MAQRRLAAWLLALPAGAAVSSAAALATARQCAGAHPRCLGPAARPVSRRRPEPPCVPRVRPCLHGRRARDGAGGAAAIRRHLPAVRRPGLPAAAGVASVQLDGRDGGRLRRARDPRARARRAGCDPGPAAGGCGRVRGRDCGPGPADGYGPDRGHGHGHGHGADRVHRGDACGGRGRRDDPVDAGHPGAHRAARHPTAGRKRRWPAGPSRAASRAAASRVPVRGVRRLPAKASARARRARSASPLQAQWGAASPPAT